ncbi:MAG: HEAT repeat domain-containing protein [Candidatus Hydrogenedentes bacterium]|nr:HEAT repeat domain-containing protein [Candidatus Hydrogenedentota bacterium]
MKGYVFRLSLAVALALAAGFMPLAGAQDAMPSEQELITVLQSDADWNAKQDACRKLRQIGTAASVPALSALLNDEKLSHMARYAMEDMDYPEVDQALRDAVGSTAGLQKMGVIISMGARRDAGAIPALVSLLEDSDALIASASAGALGRIARKPAVDALLAAKDSVADDAKPAILEGLLTAAQRLVGEDKKPQAARIYEALLQPDLPMNIQTGAFRGLAKAQPRTAPERLLAALAGDDPVFRGLAAELIAESTGPAMTRQYAAALPSLPVEGQVALLRGLADRSDSLAHEAVLNAMDSDTLEVKLAAIKALEALGTAGDVQTLAMLMQSDDEAVAGASRNTLSTMKSNEASAALVAAMDGAKPAVRAQLLELLANRLAAETVSVAKKCLNDEAPEVRTTAFRTIGQLGNSTDAPAVIAALNKASDDAERTEAANAINRLSERGGDEVLPEVLNAMNDADDTTKVVLVRSLGEIGTAKALEATVLALNSDSQPVRDEAARVLASWSSAEAAPRLLELTGSENAGWRDLALRGYVRLAREESDGAKKLDMLKTAMGLTNSPQEEFVVLAALGTLPTQGAIEMLTPRLDEPAVQTEAAAALLAVASELSKGDDAAKAQAKAALTSVAEKATNESMKQRAQEALKELGG